VTDPMTNPMNNPFINTSAGQYERPERHKFYMYNYYYGSTAPWYPMPSRAFAMSEATTLGLIWC
jgi:hypothetical protein